MAVTNMDKVTKALRRWGVININDLADITKVDRRSIYGLAKQGNATFTVANGAVVLKKIYEHMEDAKEVEVNKECEKEHWPDYLRLKDGTAFTKVEREIPVAGIVDELGGMNTEDIPTGHLSGVCTAIIQELKRRKEGEK